jgi:hypothetical protein
LGFIFFYLLFTKKLKNQGDIPIIEADNRPLIFIFFAAVVAANINVVNPPLFVYDVVVVFICSSLTEKLRKQYAKKKD